MFECFDLLTGLKINFQKSVLLRINTSAEENACMAAWMGCGVEEFPTPHLGLPLVKGCFVKVNWDPLIDRFQRRLSGWKGNLLSLGGGGRLILS
ncbi:hypothetical protein QJS10_CPA09g01075 [Acorus calamus]|uniref:Uncharacterized protein n=1 Tax=Acorus calamus TaxID=4465 RepID=A0AAV9E8U6_ACOCL|nr:hypothetical protein QJS10_CPA09g01075 [Acorus calamus]